MTQTFSTSPRLLESIVTACQAAQGFDLFLAPLLKDLLTTIPDTQEISGLDITVLDQFAANTSSSEALEYLYPLISLR